MKIKHLILLTTTAVAASSLSSCSYDDYVITREEQYARDFIKTFGLIAEGHDWTAAQHTDVTVKTQTSTKVKIYADYNGETYLFGNYDVNPGSSTLKFDIPKGATNICLKANDRKIAFTPGQTVDLSNPASRDLAAGGDYGEVKVKIERNPFGRRLNLSPDVMLQAIKKLPENDKHIESWSETNFDIVTDNFHATASTFYIFPEYWNTQRFKTNAIGIYYYIDENTSGAEKVEVTQNNEIVATYYIKRIPIIDGGINEFLKGYKSGVGHWACTYDEIPESLLQRTGDTLIKYWPDEYKWADGTETPASASFPFSEGDLIWKYTEKLYYPEGATESRWRKISSTRLGNCDPDLTTRQRLSDKMPDDYLLATLESGESWFGKPTIESVVSTQNAAHNTAVNDNENDHTNDYVGFYSEGIRVTFDKPITFGFYLAANYDGEGIRYFYSENKLNKRIQKLNDDGESEWRSPSYAATFVNGTDTEGNDKRYLCFEDWKDDNWDLNDMIFRLYGFDTIRSENPDELPNDPDSKITDEDEPKKEEDKPFRWIVACEDLGGADDYDFNDVVFGVEHVSGEREVYVTALAAGGTLDTHLMFYNGTETIEVTGGQKKSYGDSEFGQYTADGSDKTFDEWHEWFGSSSFSNMINTTSFSKVGATVVLVLPKDTEFSMANTAQDTSKFGGFSVKVINNNQEITEISAPSVNDKDGVDKGNIFPQMFVTTVDYKWPTERTSIYYSHQGDKSTEGTDITLYGSKYTIYKYSFHHWVQTSDDGFHSQPPTGSVINHGWKGYKK